MYLKGQQFVKKEGNMVEKKKWGTSHLFHLQALRYWNLFADITFAALFFKVKTNQQTNRKEKRKTLVQEDERNSMVGENTTYVFQYSVIKAMMEYMQVSVDSSNFDYMVGLERVAIRMQVQFLSIRKSRKKGKLVQVDSLYTMLNLKTVQPLSHYPPSIKRHIFFM